MKARFRLGSHAVPLNMGREHETSGARQPASCIAHGGDVGSIEHN